MNKRDYYEVLGVEKTATDDEIRKAYRKVAIQYHPDRNPGDKAAEEKFKEAAEAYDVLHDPKKRQQYDQFGFDGPSGMGGFGSRPFTMDDIFSMFGEDLNFEGFGFGSGRRAKPQKQRGQTMRMKLGMTLEDISKGLTKTFKIRKDVACEHCHGSGSEDGSAADTCPTCHGTGRITHTTQGFFGMMQTQGICPTCGGEGKVIRNKCHKCGGSGVVKGEVLEEINIPAGVAEGMILTLEGKGNAGPHNGIAGDIQVIIEEVPHDTFIRDESNLVYNLLLDFPTAALGGEVEIPTIEGNNITIKIESGTQPGKTLRLRGKGLPVLKGYGSGRGDMVVNVSVYVPKTLSKDERKSLEAMRGSDNFKGDKQTRDSIFQRFRNYFS